MHAQTTVASLRFTTRPLQRNCPKQSQTYDLRYTMTTRIHPFIPLQRNKMVFPQGVLSPLPPSNPPTDTAAAPPAVRILLGACFNCEQTGHIARDCSTSDQSRKPAVLLEPEAVKTTAEDVVECIAENCPEGPLLCQLWHGRPRCVTVRGISSEPRLCLQPMGGSGSCWCCYPHSTTGR